MTCRPVGIDHTIVAHLGYPKSDFLVRPYAISEHEFFGIGKRQFMPSKSLSIPAKHSSFLALRYPLTLTILPVSPIRQSNVREAPYIGKYPAR